MRIQHNIMAMNAYRNYTNNTSALAKNLEKLSSGYRINRAGDDAAGLAISEKMRAQITALGTAQKNVKDGISLVKTAEGATQEIHDMLNRMVSLAEQSANGTYQDEVDREAITDEFEALKSEINRIADASNFNGIKLLDGSLSTEGPKTTVNGLDRMVATLAGAADGADKVGQVTFLDGDAATEAKKTKFEMNFSDLGIPTEGNGGFTAGTAAAGTPATGAAGVDLSNGGNTISAASVTTIKGITALDVGGVTVDLSGLNIDNTKTNTEVIAAIQTAIDDAVTAANTANAAGTTTYDEISNVVVTADAGGNGFSVAFDKTTQTYDPTAAAFTASVKLNGADLAVDVDVAAGDGAKEIAEKVFAQVGTDVQVDGVDYVVSNDKDGVLTFTMKDDPTDASKLGGNFTWDVTLTGGAYKGSHTAGTNVVEAGSVKSAGARANTVFEITTADLTDGTVINLDGKKVTLSVGADSKVKDGADVVKLTDAEKADLNVALSKISEAFGGETTNFEVSVNRGAGDGKTGLAVYKKADSGKTYKTKEELAEVFSITTTAAGNGTALTLQIGDTSDDYNKLSVSISDMHTKALGLDSLSLGKQNTAADAVKVIKDAINMVSTTRGRLGATQNRLEHTANNLSTMKENIQDAEATIRDTDIAEEMMAYTKNNILVQSAQAMLAQANQIPQGVLQLLG